MHIVIQCIGCGNYMTERCVTNAEYKIAETNNGIVYQILLMSVSKHKYVIHRSIITINRASANLIYNNYANPSMHRILYDILHALFECC